MSASDRWGSSAAGREYLFEIGSERDVAAAADVEKMVRDFYEQPLIGVEGARSLDSELGRFIAKAPRRRRPQPQDPAMVAAWHAGPGQGDTGGQGG